MTAPGEDPEANSHDALLCLQDQDYPYLLILCHRAYYPALHEVFHGWCLLYEYFFPTAIIMDDLL